MLMRWVVASVSINEPKWGNVGVDLFNVVFFAQTSLSLMTQDYKSHTVTQISSVVICLSDHQPYLHTQIMVGFPYPVDNNRVVHGVIFDIAIVIFQARSISA